ncbi:MAG: MFS transporter [Clostridia bacterium]|nr:MFS transporter [Clostridia bacterium]
MAIILLAIIYMTFIGLGLPDTLLGVSWPLMHLEFGVNEGMAGAMSLTISAGTIISSLFSGKITQRLRTEKLTAISVLMTGVGILLISFMPSIYMFFLFAIPLGLGAGAVDTSLNNYVSRHFKPRHMSWLHALWGVGAMTGPVLMSFFLKDGEWRPGYLCVAGILLCMSLLLFLTLPVWKKFEQSKINNEDDEEKTKEKHSLIDALRQRGVIVSMISFLFYCGIEMLIGLWGSTYLINIKGIDAAKASLWISFFFAGVTLARVLSGFLTIKMKSSQQLRLGQGIIIIGAILLLFPLSANAAAIVIVIIGVGCAPVFPIMLHETPARFGKENSEAVMGLQLASAFTGSAFMPLIFGYLASATSFQMFPNILFVFAVVVVICTEGISTLTKKKQ